MLSNWLKDDLFRRISKNAGVLLAGGVAGQAMSFIAFTLMARSVGPERLGIFSLIQAYVLTVGQLLSVQSWQAMVKYGADALEQGQPHAFRGLMKLGMCVDAAAALLGCVLAIGIAYGAAAWRGWTPETLQMIVVFSLVILTRITSAPAAILRLFGEFRQVAIQQVLAAGVRLGGIVAVSFYTKALWPYLLIWVGGEVVGNAYVTLAAFWRMRKEGHGGFLATSLREVRTQHPGILRFLLTTNLSNCVRLGTKEADIFVVASLLGTEATGVYRIAREFGRIPAVVVGPLQDAVYPEVARLWATRQYKAFVRTLKRIGMLSGVVGMLVWLAAAVGAPWILQGTVGAQYHDARFVLSAYMLATVIFAAGIGLRPAILSVGRPQTELYVFLAASVAYFSAMVMLTRSFGLIGAGLAQVVFQVIWFVLMIQGLRGPIRDAQALAPCAAPEIECLRRS
jgi:O-antigen/teichoic acid export membrane protein